DDINADDIMDKYKDDNFLNLPPSRVIKSKEIQAGSGIFKRMKQLQRKKRNTEGQRIDRIEKDMKNCSLQFASNVFELQVIHNKHHQLRSQFKDFYYSNNSIRKVRSSQIQLKSYKYRLCSRERKFVTKNVKSKRAKLIMFVGDRGFGFGSHIKDHLKYGGKWKQEIHSKYTHAVITNENMTSQTCVYCYSKLDHPTHTRILKGKTIYRKSKGSFLCRNPSCVLLKNGKAAKCRDDLSALAIGLSGLAKILFQETLPAFRTTFSQCDTEYKNKTSTFLTRKSGLDSNAVAIR
ncbi:hypothetical protein EDC94DRAFT_522357, partial [Helicostylum pulchrum]